MRNWQQSHSSELPIGWTMARIKDLGLVQLGRQRSPSHRSNLFPTPYVRAANITWAGLCLDDVLEMEFTPKERATYQLEVGDLLLSEASGSASEVGKPAVWNGALSLCCFQNTVIRFRPQAVESRYALHLFTHLAVSSVFANASRGVGIHHLGAQRFESLEVPVPPLVEQARISDRIDELFTDLAAGVAALERVKRNLSRYRAAVLHAAVTGRLTEAWRQVHGPPNEPGPKLLERILVDRRRQWEHRTLTKYEKAGKQPPKNWRDRYPDPSPPKPPADGSPLPTLPEGWCWATHDQIGDVQLGRQRSPQHHTGEHMRPYLRVANVYEDRIDLSDVLSMNFTPDEFETYELRHGDILLNEGQSMELVGRPAMYRGELPGGCFQNTLVRQRAIGGVSPDYVLIVCRAQFRAGRFRKIASITTSIAHLGAQRFAALEFPLPPVDEQAAIIEAVNEKLSQIDNLEAEVDRGLARASRLRQAILKSAFEGKLVPQNAADEPASTLLDRIRAEADAQVERSQGNNGAVSRRRGRAAQRSKTAEPRGIYFKRAAVAAYAVRTLADSKYFGRTQLEKVLYLTQSHIGIDLSLQFKRKAAGPYDQAIHKIESLARKRRWFQTRDRTHGGVRYEPGPAIADRCEWVERNLADKRAELDSLLSVFKKMKTEQAELFATVYAAWNDLLADGKSAGSDVIVAEVRGWHESKQRFEPQRIKQCIDWMRQHGYVPRGERGSTITEGASK